MWRAAALLLIGCGPIASPSDYAEARAEAECARIRTCERGQFEAEWRDDEDCVDDQAEAIDENNDDLDDADCRYVAEEAGACVRRIAGLSCESWFEGESGLACDLVWNCSEEDR